MTAALIGVYFIIIFLFTNHLIPTNKIKRLRWLSFSGGLAVSYVFVYVLPLSIVSNKLFKPLKII